MTEHAAAVCVDHLSIGIRPLFAGRMDSTARHSPESNIATPAMIMDVAFI